MPRNKKRKRNIPNHDNAPSSPPSPTPTTPATQLLTKFHQFEDITCELLSAASSIPNLHTVLTAPQANFLTALQTIQTHGDLPWIQEISPSSTPSPPNWPPPLPSITQPLLLQTFTPNTNLNSHLPSSHYQRLEWLGDAYLEATVSRILHDRFPSAREGGLSQLRQHLVANRFLSTLAAAYRFQDSIVGVRDEPRFVKGVEKSQRHWKVMADCFEAYVAAVAISDGYGTERLVAWLTELYRPEIENGGGRVKVLGRRGVRMPRRGGKEGARGGRVREGKVREGKARVEVIDLESEWEEVEEGVEEGEVSDGRAWKEVDGVVVIDD